MKERVAAVGSRGGARRGGEVEEGGRRKEGRCGRKERGRKVRTERG